MFTVKIEINKINYNSKLVTICILSITIKRLAKKILEIQQYFYVLFSSKNEQIKKGFYLGSIFASYNDF